MNFTLKIWRQKDAKTKGAFETYKVENISADTSFLEMLDILNNNLIHEGKEPVAFDHDCREGICGMCSLHIDGHAHGPGQGATTCQIYMRKFKDGATITIEPWRSAAFPVIKDLVVNRSAYDQILQAGGFISVRTNSVPDANAILIPKASWENTKGFYIKYGMRNAMEIATTGCSVNVRLSGDKKTFDRVRIAYGVAGPVPMRAPSAEAVVNGQPVTMENIEAFSRAVLEDINPRDSWRASKAFRKHIAVEMAKRALIESVKRCGGEI